MKARGHTDSSRGRRRVPGTVLLLFLCTSLCFFCVCVVAEEDFYKLLGVSRTATKREIKSAYRRKALDTHPDKNKDVPPEEAAAAFQKVVRAFEVLTDESSRKQYDRTGRAPDQQNAGGGGRNSQHQQQGGWSFSWSTGRSYYQRPKLKDRFDVKESQSRILHIVSLEQLETVIVDDDDDTLERNLVIAFYTPPLEKHLMEELVYPWPFAGMSAQGIWWEDLLQTTSVRFHRSNKLTEFFGITAGSELQQPVFVFCKRGTKFQELSKHCRQFTTTDRTRFETWMWQRIEVDVEFVNEHDHEVEIYWIHGTRAEIKGKVKPGETVSHRTMLSHEWYFRDARTDTRSDSPGRHRLTSSTKLIDFKITSDEHNQRLVIPRRTCLDLSAHCAWWDNRRECTKNPRFMAEVCQETCKLCTEETIEDESEKNNSDDGAHDEF